MITVPQQAGAFRIGHTRANSLPERIFGLVVAATIEAALVYVLLTTLGVVHRPKVLEDLHIVNVPPETSQAETPIPIAPIVEVPRIPEPITTEITIQIPEDAVRNPITEVPMPPQQPPQRVTKLEPPPVITFSPARALLATHTTPDYPPVSRRLGEQGTLRLKLSITAQGAVSDAMVVNSSGHPRLDEAAVDWVKAHWRYQPAMRGPSAVPSTTDAVVTFKLQ
jgi:protein TonB